MSRMVQFSMGSTFKREIISNGLEDFIQDGQYFFCYRLASSSHGFDL